MNQNSLQTVNGCQYACASSSAERFRPRPISTEFRCIYSSVVFVKLTYDISQIEDEHVSSLAANNEKHVRRDSYTVGIRVDLQHISTPWLFLLLYQFVGVGRRLQHAIRFCPNPCEDKDYCFRLDVHVK